MAILVAAGGAALGGITGIGANLGWIIGGIVGNILFPPDPIVNEGPRLGDLAVTSSAYGAPRTVGYGTIRMAGNIIWSTPIREQKNVEEVGGKGIGGPTVENVTYTYFATFALGLGEGVAEDVLRIWADGKLIFDKRGTETNTRKEGLKFRFYPGNATQLPDPAMELDLGAANTPAHRDTVYVLFDDLPLEDFGNRIPNMTVEVAYKTTPAKLYQEGGASNSGFSLRSDFLAVDLDRGYAYYAEAEVGGGIIRYNLETLQEDRIAQAADIFTSSPVGIKGIAFFDILPNGDLLCQLATGSNSAPLILIDGPTLKEKSAHGSGGSSLSYSPTNVKVSNRARGFSLYATEARQDYVILRSTVGSDAAIYRTDTGTLEYVWDSDTDTVWDGLATGRTLHGVVGGKTGIGVGEAYAILAGTYSTTPQTAPVTIWRFRLGSGAHYTTLLGDSLFVNTDIELVGTFTPADLFPGETLLDAVAGIWYDATDDTVIFYASSDTLGTQRFFKYDPNTGSIVWTTEPLALGLNSTDIVANIKADTFGYIRSTNGVQINTVTGEIIHNNESPNYAIQDVGTGDGFYDSLSESWIGYLGSSAPLGRFFFNRTTANDALLSDIVTDLCVRTGLEAADLDVSDLTSDIVPGYFVGRSSTARAAIEPLASLFLFDGFESDWLLKFKKRGQASVRSLTQDDLANLDEAGDIFRENRIQEVELPLRFSLIYLDKDNDYTQQTHSARRILDPTPAMSSHNQMGISVNAALGADFTKQQAEQSLYSAWIERNNYNFRWDWSQLDLDPSDVVDITLDDGTFLLNRITQFDVGDGFTIEANTISQQTAQFQSTVSADAGSGVTTQVIRGSTVIESFILDTPLLRDQDEPASRAFNPIYFFMSGYQDGRFTRGGLYKSADNIAYANVGSIVSEASWGSVGVAMPDPPWDNPFAIDKTSSINVFMNVGGDNLVSVTELQMLNGSNPAMILKANGEMEVINFQNVTVEADGSYTLDTFLRGRRGTDTMSFGHLSNETFLLLSTVGDIFGLTLGELDLLRYYRSVGAGQLFEDGNYDTLTSNHRALMPRAPYNFTATEDVSNNIDTTWDRRSRIGGDLQSFIGTVAVNEDAEEYELEIYDGPGGTLLRTVTGLTTNSYEYTNADIITDFGAVPALLTAKVYQISAQVGRGFAYEFTVDVL